MSTIESNPSPEMVTTELVGYDGGEVKSLGGGKVAGYLVRFSGPEDADQQDEYFDRSTYFGRSKDLDILYLHGMPMIRGDRYWPKFRNRPIGGGAVKAMPDGLWFEGELDLSKPHVADLYHDIEAGKIGWSSGSVERLVVREPVKSRLGRMVHRILQWPLNEASLTPKPVDPNNRAYAIKALLDPEPRELDELAAGPSLADDLLRLAADAERLLGLATKAVDQRISEGRTLSQPKLDAIKALADAYTELHARCLASGQDVTPQPDPLAQLALEIEVLSLYEAAIK